MNAAAAADHCTPLHASAVVVRGGSPDAPNAVIVEDAIIADDGHVLELCLHNEHPIERITMVALEAAGALSVEYRDVQGHEPLTANAAEDIHGNVFRAGELAQSLFRRDFPGGGGAHKDRIRLVSDQAARLRACRAADARQPCSPVSSGGTGSKNARVTLARPRMAPNRRPGRTGRSRVRRATGVLPRAMMTSSPRSTCSTNRDKCVLAA
jgi:hypothetical protein